MAFLGLKVTPDNQIVAVGATNHRHVAPYEGDVLVIALILIFANPAATAITH